jgi:hypothetical protein
VNLQLVFFLAPITIIITIITFTQLCWCGTCTRGPAAKTKSDAALSEILLCYTAATLLSSKNKKRCSIV